HAVEPAIGQLTEGVDNGRPELLKGTHCVFADGRGAAVTGYHRRQLRARPVRSMDEPAEDRMLIGQRGRAVAEEPQQVAGVIEWMGNQAAAHSRTYGMKFKLKGCRHAKVSTPTTYRPEQIGLLILAGPQYLAFGGDELDRAKIVEGETVFAHQPA